MTRIKAAIRRADICGLVFNSGASYYMGAVLLLALAMSRIVG